MEEKTVGDGLMTIFAEFGWMLALDPTSEKETWFPLSVIDDNDK